MTTNMELIGGVQVKWFNKHVACLSGNRKQNPPPNNLILKKKSAPQLMMESFLVEFVNSWIGSDNVESSVWLTSLSDGKISETTKH